MGDLKKNDWFHVTDINYFPDFKTQPRFKNLLSQIVLKLLKYWDTFDTG